MYYWESNGYDTSVEETINLSMPAPALISSRGVSGVRSWPCKRMKALFYSPARAFKASSFIWHRPLGLGFRASKVNRRAHLAALSGNSSLAGSSEAAGFFVPAEHALAA